MSNDKRRGEQHSFGEMTWCYLLGVHDVNVTEKVI